MIGLTHRVAGNAGERGLVAKGGTEGTFVWFGLVALGRPGDKCVEMPRRRRVDLRGQEDSWG